MQKKKVILVAIILVAVAIAGAVMAVTMSGRKDNQTDKSDVKSTSGTSSQQNALLGPTFTDPQTGVTVRAPKDWELAPKSTENPNSLTRFQHSKSRANGELTVLSSNASMDDVLRGYLEGGINLDYKTTLIENRSVVVGGTPARLLIQDIPGPSGQTARLAQYFFNKDGTYYILTYTVLGSDWKRCTRGLRHQPRVCK